MTADPANGRCGACRDLGVLHTHTGDCRHREETRSQLTYVGDTEEGVPHFELSHVPPAAENIPDHMRELQPILEEVRAVMYERGRKYGPGNIAEFGELGVLVRLSDKLARLKNSKDDFSDESVADTWLDVVGYGLIGLMIQKGLWPK